MRCLACGGKWKDKGPGCFLQVTGTFFCCCTGLNLMTLGDIRVFFMAAEKKDDLKSTFLWSRTGNCWVSRAKEPNLWRAKQIAAKLGFMDKRRRGERLSFSEQVERQAERAEQRVERYEQYAENAARRGAALQQTLDRMRGDIAFFTQPTRCPTTTPPFGR